MRFVPRHSVMLLLVATLPIEVDVPAPLSAGRDSAGTSARFYGGGGRYALISRGCDATHAEAPGSFGEVGAGVQHQARSGFTTGLRAEYVNETLFVHPGTDTSATRRRDVFLVSPRLGWERKWFGLGLGLVAASNPLHRGDLSDKSQDDLKVAPSMLVRLGSLHSFYGTASLFDRFPLYTTSYFQVGAGYGGNDKIQGCLGVGAMGPNNNGGLVGEVNYQLSPRWTLDTDFRLGSSEGMDESAATLGLTWHQVRAPGDVR